MYIFFLLVICVCHVPSVGSLATETPASWVEVRAAGEGEKDGVESRGGEVRGVEGKAGRAG